MKLLTTTWLVPLAGSVLSSTLCMAVSAHKPATPLVKQAMRLLRELVQASVEKRVNKALQKARR